ncbi:unannotated protein [freshwater metagenome]|uniref:Unannotated protein n=1 Tax=freshwater metagenome TaxID=449393 RepID=A0A6J6PR56_9ZZZZ
MSELLQALNAARSFLIFPGDDARKQERALGSNADVLTYDLEDGVAAAQKAVAREGAAAFAAAAGAGLRLIRINDPLSAAGEADLAVVAAIPNVGIVVPKASPAGLDRAAEIGKPLLALIEEAKGVRDAYAIAEHDAVFGLAIGVADMSAALGLSPYADGLQLLFVRSQLVVASAAAGIRAPVDGPCLDVRDHDALERETSAARALGLRGKFCLHPDQVAGVHAALAPTQKEFERAQRIVAAWSEIAAAGGAVGAIDGLLVDRPVALRAQAVIDAYERNDA